jgi:hypothetical protein
MSRSRVRIALTVTPDAFARLRSGHADSLTCPIIAANVAQGDEVHIEAQGGPLSGTLMFDVAGVHGERIDLTLAEDWTAPRVLN